MSIPYNWQTKEFVGLHPDTGELVKKTFIELEAVIHFKNELQRMHTTLAILKREISDLKAALLRKGLEDNSGDKGF